MRLSELRPILKKLRAAGYRRDKLFGGYRKRWTKMDCHFQHVIGDYELLLLVDDMDIDLLLEHAERRAQYEFKYIHGLGGL